MHILFNFNLQLIVICYYSLLCTLFINHCMYLPILFIYAIIPGDAQSTYILYLCVRNLRTFCIFTCVTRSTYILYLNVCHPIYVHFVSLRVPRNLRTFCIFTCVTQSTYILYFYVCHVIFVHFVSLRAQSTYILYLYLCHVKI